MREQGDGEEEGNWEAGGKGCRSRGRGAGRRGNGHRTQVSGPGRPEGGLGLTGDGVVRATVTIAVTAVNPSACRPVSIQLLTQPMVTQLGFLMLSLHQQIYPTLLTRDSQSKTEVTPLVRGSQTRSDSTHQREPNQK